MQTLISNGLKENLNKTNLSLNYLGEIVSPKTSKKYILSHGHIYARSCLFVPPSNLELPSHLFVVVGVCYFPFIQIQLLSMTNSKV